MRRAEGGRIDRARPLRFTFDGRALTGFAGDTVASALLANGVHLIGRSFKYHRPRGFLGAGVEEPNALVGISHGPGRFEPNARATCVPLIDGLVVESQNRWPSLAFDLGAINDLAAPLIPAGFYYKTFMWPAKAWAKLYEPRIRAAAGLGRAPDAPDPDHYGQRWAHCETLVVGGGPAGIAAALAAAEAGGRVLLCDQDEELGGGLLASPGETVEGRPAWEWLADALARLAALANVRMLPRTTAVAYGVGNMVTLAERRTDHLAAGEGQGARQRLWLVRAGRVVLATGAIERPLVFPGNDRPGVMLASAARSYANRWGVLAGSRAVLLAGDPSGPAAAADLRAAGMDLTVIDPAEDPPVETRGRLRVSGVRFAKRGWVECDVVLMAGGWTPSVHLQSQSRGTPAWDAALGAFVPGRSMQAEMSAGACRGVLDTDACIADGKAAALLPLKGGDGSREARAGGGSLHHPQPQAVETTRSRAAAAPRLPAPPSSGRSFVDFQNDVTAKDLRLAIREGFQSVEHLKRYTTTGMATDQGRTSNINALTIAAAELGVTPDAVGLTTFRAPFTPTTFGTFANYHRGALFEPARRTPTHLVAAASGAVFEDVGQWKRARFFPGPGEGMDAAVARECRAVRADAGVFDASTLGKIEVAGPDAAAFLELMYVNAFRKLGVGRCRYGLMLREDGFILDDGVIGRIAEDRFHVTTTTGGAARVLELMEDFRQTERPDLQVWLTSTTERWAVVAVQGPHARAIVEPLVDGVDWTAFPHMSVAECTIMGAPGRLFRVSFTGELGFEMNVPAARGAELWEAVLAAGATPYGTETMHVLRAEKGYIIVGQETDGTVTPDDVGLAGLIGKAKADFVGKRSLARPALSAAGRKQLVGLEPVDGRTMAEEGAQLVAEAGSRVPLGHVTSSYRSAALGRPIALALLADGRARIGSEVRVAGGATMRVVSPVFLDPEGARLDAPRIVTPGDAGTHHPAPIPEMASRFAGNDGLEFLAERDGLVARRLAPERQHVLHLAPADAAELGLPAAMLTAAPFGGGSALHLAPDEWLLIEATPPAIAAPHSLVEVGDRTLAVALDGPLAAAALAAGCPLDLAACPVGFASRTLFGKVAVVLQRTGDAVWRLDYTRSFDGYVTGLLALAAQDAD